MSVKIQASDRNSGKKLSMLSNKELNTYLNGPGPARQKAKVATELRKRGASAR